MDGLRTLLPYCSRAQPGARAGSSVSPARAQVFVASDDGDALAALSARRGGVLRFFSTPHDRTMLRSDWCPPARTHARTHARTPPGLGGARY